MFDGKVPPPHGNPFRVKQMLGAAKQQQQQQQQNRKTISYMEVNGTRQALKAEKYVKTDESSFCLSEATLRINIMRLKSRKSWEKSHVLRSKLIFYLKAV